MVYDEKKLRLQIIEIGRRLEKKGYIPGASGNISVRIEEGIFLITPTGVNKGELLEEDIIKVNQEGKILAGNLQPSSELKMHLGVYRERSDVRVIIHAHPPYSTTFAVAGIPLTKPLLPEVVIMIGEVPLVEYATPSTYELPYVLRKYLKNHNVFLLANHGVLAIGYDLKKVCYLLETTEFYAQVAFLAKVIGKERCIAEKELTKLMEIKALHQ